MHRPYSCNSDTCSGRRIFLPEDSTPVCDRCGNVRLDPLEIIHLIVPDPQGLIGSPPHRIACMPPKLASLPPFFTSVPKACTCTYCNPQLLVPEQKPQTVEPCC
jgi:hypothetical protein